MAVRGAVPRAAPAAPDVPPPVPGTLSSDGTLGWKARLRDALPLMGVGLGFLAGAAAASAGHARLLQSPYPLWILLAIDGVIAAAAGTLSLFLREPDRPIDDDPDIVRVPRREWEALLLRLQNASQRSVGRREAPEWQEPPAVVAAPAPPPVPEAAAPLPLEPARPNVLHREVALLELQSLAESALVTRESLGPEEFDRFLEISAEDIERIGTMIDRPGRNREPAIALLVRLLREAADRADLPIDRRTAEELRRQAERLAPYLPTGDRPAAVAPAGPRIGTAADEVESLLKELEEHQEPPRKPARKSTKSSRSQTPP